MCRALLFLFISILTVQISKAATRYSSGPSFAPVVAGKINGKQSLGPQFLKKYMIMCSLDNCLTTGVSAWRWLFM